jgi:hypothetical protein
LFVGSGFFREDATGAGSIAYSDFQIWSLAGVNPQEVLAPAIELTPAVFSDLVAAASAADPAAGPTSGDLVQAVGAATVAPAGVNLESFLARATFINPTDAADSPWDFGIAFREQENGDHFRLTVASDGTWEFQIGLQEPLAEGTVPSLTFDQGDANTLELMVLGNTAGFSVNGAFISQIDVSELTGESDVWVGSGFHQADANEGAVTHFQDFSVWPVEADLGLPEPAATPVPSAAVGGRQVALKLAEMNGSGVDGLAVLSEEAGATLVTVTVRNAAGGEVVVVHDGTCQETSALPAFLLEDLDATGRSETSLETPLADLTDGKHSIAVHRSAENYAEVLACGDIQAE